jgi:catechol 2,3-dioxygenase
MSANTALFRPDRFAHANIFVADVNESVAFYRDVCGLTEVFREPGIKAGFLSNGATHHDMGLMQVSSAPLIGRDGSVQNTMVRGRRPGLNHIAFHVCSEASLIEAYRNAERFDIAVEKALDHGMSRSLYLYDPDGNAVEFYIDSVPDWRGFYAENQNNLISARWDPLTTPPFPAFEPLPRLDTRVDGAALQSMEICGGTFFVADLPRSLDFYRRIAGLELISQSGEAALLGLPGQQHACMALVAAGRDEQAGLHSLWFFIAPQSFLLSQPAMPAGMARQTRQEGARCFARDPNGIYLAFYTGAALLPREASRADALACLREEA